MQLQDIIRAIETKAPLDLQESYDNAGLQYGVPTMEVSRVLTCLDVTETVIEEAHRRGCQLVVSHHPLLFHGVRQVNPESDYISRVLVLAIRYGVAIYAAHTNLDKARGGVNDALAARLGLHDVTPMSECGVWGRLPVVMSRDALLEHIRTCLKPVDACIPVLRYNAEAGTAPQYRTLALCTGSGADFIAEAERLGVDAYLTGEVRYHEFFGHPHLLIVEAGHYETEWHTAPLLAEIISQALPEVECMVADANRNPCVSFDRSMVRLMHLDIDAIYKKKK